MKNCSDMSTGRRVLFTVWIAIAGWRLRELWQWKADSGDNECSCYDVVSVLSLDAFLANDTIVEAQLS
jgi:hypothetical protein